MVLLPVVLAICAAIAFFAGIIQVVPLFTAPPDDQRRQRPWVIICIIVAVIFGYATYRTSLPQSGSSSPTSILVLHSSYSGTFTDTTFGTNGPLAVSNVSEDTITGTFTGKGTSETAGETCFFQVTNGLITADGKMTWIINDEQSSACNAGTANATGQLNDGVITGSWTNTATQDTGTFTLS